FTLPQNDSGLMRPALDGQGHLWFGEMNRNYLGSFNAHNSTFWQQEPPRGQFGIMGIVAAPDNTIWFTEQYADYIGHYFPATGQYKTYPLPTLSLPDPSGTHKTLSLPSAPNDLILDKHGILWFTEINANAIGSLNTANGSIHHYPLTSAPNAKPLDPYGLTIDPQGTIWFTEITSNRLGHLNPLTGQVSYFTPPEISASTPLMEVVSDAHGQIWATTFAVSQLIHFDPLSHTFTTYSNPMFTGGLYDLSIAANGDVWVTVTSKNILARLDVKAQRFLVYTIPTPNSLPIGLVVGQDQAVWFTESGSNKIGKLQV
ncbi:MAG: virginiamycin B lyase family protein, partial [Ktedonobacteraceae bacterium]